MYLHVLIKWEENLGKRRKYIFIKTLKKQSKTSKFYLRLA